MTFLEDFDTLRNLRMNAVSIEEKLDELEDSPLTEENLQQLVSLGENLKTAYGTMKRGLRNKKDESLRIHAKKAKELGLDKKYDHFVIGLSKKINSEFLEAYAECDRLDETRRASQREVLEDICNKHSRLSNVPTVRKRKSKLRNRRIESYTRFLDRIKSIDEGAANLEQEYANKDVETEAEVKRLLNRAKKISKAYRKAVNKHIPQTKIWLINPHKAYSFTDKTEKLRLELSSLLATFGSIKSQKTHINALKAKVKERTDYVRNLPESLGLKEALRATEKEEQKCSAGSLTSYACFRKTYDEYLTAIEELKNVSREKRESIVEKVLGKIKESYTFSESVLGKDTGSEGYETLIARARQRLDDSKADIDTVKTYADCSDEEKKYNELSAAIDARISEIGQYKETKQTEARIAEKDLDYKMREMEHEKEKLRKKREIRRLELQAVKSSKKPAKESQPKVVYMPAQSELVFNTDKDFCSMFLEISELEAPNDFSIIQLGEMLKYVHGEWAEKFGMFSDYASELSTSSGSQNKDYLKKLRDIMDRSIKKGSLTKPVTMYPEVKEAAYNALESLDNYIALCEQEEVLAEVLVS